jgi:hypothetical protein
MTRDDLAKYPRETPREIMIKAGLSALPTNQLELLLDSALNLEWWRGYHAARAETVSTNAT